ncbi:MULTISPECIES: glycosyltransferase family 2 protein [Burkholderia]|uniref:Rhamnosyltransferase n=1 Tax=Burkholderia ubonensis TaxID=101571 RepID=A0A1B4LCQ1_9BURK|nr:MULTISPECIES: glycosyltransferase family 2 protein [Burkholderia]AOJ74957.1 rhamnosyltransferase [Burkholderia ubonensis]AOK09432.1 rhamnosyltransferase [Burkholderia vietnamiensis]KVE03838.1 rhamnosyltransferase [Burkholderia vietnamiensis]KVE61406.1 rhamnosyltransferase [Burkholderia vietnamiensis]KVF09278.1 rhamnosyltransferase [Burkholderia vietnamiensis]
MTECSVSSQKTGIVVVFYRPNADCIRNANRLVGFGDCIVVDNTEGNHNAGLLGLDPEIEYIANGRNLGIATALNQGVERLLERGCRWALLFDQDSQPTSELLTGLPKRIDVAVRRNPRVALAGPAYADARLGGVAPFIQFRHFSLKRIRPTSTEPVSVDFLITSGSCLNLSLWHEIGPMDDSLFIDFVDLEWCVRARARGCLILGIPDITLVHELGGEPVRVFGRLYPSHSALRHYYLFRNAVLLIKRDYVPLSWKSTELIKFPFRLAIYGAFMTPRMQHIRLSLLGLWHGLSGRSGRLDLQ